MWLVRVNLCVCIYTNVQEQLLIWKCANDGLLSLVLLWREREKRLRFGFMKLLVKTENWFMNREYTDIYKLIRREGSCGFKTRWKEKLQRFHSFPQIIYSGLGRINLNMLVRHPTFYVSQSKSASYYCKRLFFSTGVELRLKQMSNCFSVLSDLRWFLPTEPSFTRRMCLEGSPM